MEYKDLKPEGVFKFFKEISDIPRESHHEKEVSDYLVAFAKERNLEVYQDDVYNVLIKKPASAGLEQRPTVAIQGHMDMVCVKDDEKEHDFRKDPIKLIVDGNKLHADKTTLGADDGIAVAYALAILDSSEIKHPALEVLITTAEETNMGGASNFDTSKLSCDYLINIDSEVEGEFTVGCAGGVEVNSVFKKEYDSLFKHLIEIKISKLTGGHSGMEIDKFRKNAIKELARFLNALDKKRIVSINGGSKKNAIATNASLLLTVDDLEKSLKVLEELKENVIHEAKATDAEIQIEINNVDSKLSDYKKAFTDKLTENLTNYLYLLPNGLFKKDLELNTIVSSANVGILAEDEDNVTVNSFVRSSSLSEKHNYRDQIEALGLLTGANVTFDHEFPGWEKEESEIIPLCQKLFKETTGKDSVVTTTHGGLECGFLKKQMPNTVMISFGPNLYDVHTSRESADIDSIQRMFDFTVRLLGSIE